MLKYCFFLLLLSASLFGQEQVSDIENYGVTRPTHISSKVGFAIVDGTQYMIQENDSITIYKLENGSFNYQSTIENIDCDQKIYSSIDPNRSLFEVRGRFYYRFLYNGIQVIDVVSGTIHKQYDFGQDSISRIYPVELHQDIFYFREREFGLDYFYFFDITNDSVGIVNVPGDRGNHKQIYDQIAGVKGSNQVFVYDAYTNEDTKVYESNTGIFSLSYSYQDSTFVILENDGTMLKVDRSLNVQNMNCTLSNLPELRRFRVNGDKLIAVYKHIEEGPRQDRVVITDITTCTEDFSFITDAIQSFVYGIQFVINENNEKEVSVFGYFGTHPSDGFDEGLYYIIYHENDTATKINEISYLQDHTPFIHDNFLYLIGLSGSFWGYYANFIKYDIAASTVTKLDPNEEYTTNTSSLGYHDETNDLITVTNTFDEEPVVWRLDSMENFSKIRSLNFLRNLGVLYQSKIYPKEEKIYFLSHNGLYSVLDHSNKEIEVIDDSKLKNRPKIEEMATYSDKLAFAVLGDDKITFKILNTTTGAVDSVVVDDVTLFSNLAMEIFIVMGPLIFYKSDGELFSFDLRSETVQLHENVSGISSYNLVKGDGYSIYLRGGFSTERKAYRIDYSSNRIELLELEFDKTVEVVAGYDSSFYFIDWDYMVDSTRIRLMKKNGDVSVVYHGKGRYNKHYSTSSSFVNSSILFSLYHNNESLIFITNNLQDTEEFIISNTFLSSVRASIMSRYEDRFILKTRDDMGYHYWLYEAFKPVVELETPATNMNLAFSDINDSLAILVFHAYDLGISLVKYDYQNNDTKIMDVEGGCDYFTSSADIAMNKNEYLLNMRCGDEGYEPWVFNIKNGNLSLLADLYPGGSSYPKNLVKFKDWVYFTASLKDGSRQWFRVKAGGSTKVLELIKDSPSELSLYPSPANQTVFIDSDLEELSIYSVKGDLIYSQSKYINNQPIQVNFLENGTYMIHGVTKNKELKTGKFVMMK